MGGLNFPLPVVPHIFLRIRAPSFVTRLFVPILLQNMEYRLEFLSLFLTFPAGVEVALPTPSFPVSRRLLALFIPELPSLSPLPLTSSSSSVQNSLKFSD